MARGDKLEVTIGADITDFEKKIKEVEFDIKELSKVKLEKIKLGLDTKEINAQIKDAKSNLVGLKTALKDTGSQVGGQFTKQVGNGNNALMQFSRIAQDAPYGIIGIGNNITATTEAFSYLKTQTGSTSGALKAMASSLMGTGGILLGVSLLTTGLTLLSQSGLSVKDIFNKLTGQFDEFGEAVKKASEEGLKSAGKEVESLRALVAVAQNDNIAKKDRLIAVENLQKQFPAYYGNLSAEKIMYGDLTKETQAATKALIAKAVAEKLGDKAADVFLERMAAQKKFNDAKKKIEDFDLKNGIQNIEKLTRAEGMALTSKEQLERQIATNIAVVRQNLLDKAEEERQSLIKTLGVYEKYTDIIDKLNETAAPLSQTAPKAGKDVKSFNTPQVTGLQSFITPLELTPIIDTSKISTSMKMVSQIISEESIRAMEAMIQFNENVNSIIESSIVSTFGNLGTVIGDALSSGANVLEAVGSSLLQSLGNLLSSLGDELIKLGTAAVLAGTVVKLFGTISGVGAGLLAIAGGMALKGVGTAMGQKANDKANGKASTSTSTGRGANNTSTTSGGGGGWSGGGNGTVVFEIAGTSLIGVLNNTTERNLRIGGSN